MDARLAAISSLYFCLSLSLNLTLNLTLTSKCKDYKVEIAANDASLARKSHVYFPCTVHSKSQWLTLSHKFKLTTIELTTYLQYNATIYKYLHCIIYNYIHFYIINFKSAFLCSFCYVVAFQCLMKFEIHWATPKYWPIDLIFVLIFFYKYWNQIGGWDNQILKVMHFGPP